MSFHFFFTKKAEEDLARLDTVARKRIIKKIASLGEYDIITHITKPLTGDFQTYHRIRVGQYRLVCEVEGGLITILRVQHRKEVYR